MTIIRLGSKEKRQRISLSHVFCYSIIKKSVCVLSLLYVGHLYAQENPWTHNFKKDLPSVADVQKGICLKDEPHDHHRLYNTIYQHDIVTQAVKNNLGIHLSANHPFLS